MDKESNKTSFKERRSTTNDHIVFTTKEEVNDLIYKYSDFYKPRSRSRPRQAMNQMDRLINSKLNEELTIKEKIGELL